MQATIRRYALVLVCDNLGLVTSGKGRRQRALWIHYEFQDKVDYDGVR